MKEKIEGRYCSAEFNAEAAENNQTCKGQDKKSFKLHMKAYDASNFKKHEMLLTTRRNNEDAKFSAPHFGRAKSSSLGRVDRLRQSVDSDS